MIYLGIDPGTSGSATVLSEKGTAIAYSDGRLRSLSFAKSSHYEMAEWFKGISGEEVVAVLEKVHAMPGQGVSSMFTFGLNTGFVKGLLVANQIAFTELHPKTWQKKLGIPGRNTKSESKEQFKARLVKVAQGKWPRYASQINKGNADSMLLAAALRLTELGK